MVHKRHSHFIDRNIPGSPMHYYKTSVQVKYYNNALPCDKWNSLKSNQHRWPLYEKTFYSSMPSVTHAFRKSRFDI